MAWNEPGSSSDNNQDSNKGTHKKEGPDPWTGRQKSPGPPDLEAALRKLQQKFLQKFAKKKRGINTPPDPDNNSGSLKITGIGTGIILLVLILLWALSGIFIVGPAEQSVILCFGKYAGTVGPGPHWLPRFIETAYTVDEQKISTYSYDAEMLTKDENIVSVAVAVQYRIGDARNYLFSVVNPEESLQQATASALRQVIGHTNLTEVLTSGREQIRQEILVQLTKILARYNTGLLITDVAMQPAKAPEEVKEAFDDAIKAQEDEQRYENQAQSYAMQVEPIAKGQAQRLLADAKGYQRQVVLHAQADIAPFLALLPQYQKAPAVTRERMYLETIEEVLANTPKVLVDTPGNNNMFYLPLDKLMQSVVSQAQNKQTSPSSSSLSTTETPVTPRMSNNNGGGNERPGGYS